MAINNDGDIPIGSHAVTINTVSYIFESVSVNQSSAVIESNDENGEPRGEAIIPGRWTGSGTLQLPDDTAELPVIGDTFTLDLDRDGTAETYKISEVGAQYEAAGETKVPVTIRKRINTPTP